MDKAGVGTRVRLRSIPTNEPPYDDERPPDWLASGSAQPLFALGEPGRVATSPPGQPLGAPAPRAPLPASASPPTAAAAVRFVNTCLEIFNGYRAVTHFRALANPLYAGHVVEAMTHALRRLRRARAPLPGGPAPVRLRQMRTCEPRDGVAEIAVVLGTRTGATIADDHCWALAFRLELWHGRWLCTSARLL